MAHDLSGLVVHRDDAWRMTDRAAPGQVAAPRDQLLQLVLRPVQDEFDTGIATGRFGKPADDRGRSAIPTHCINRNDHAARKRGIAGFRQHVGP